MRTRESGFITISTQAEFQLINNFWFDETDNDSQREITVERSNGRTVHVRSFIVIFRARRSRGDKYPWISITVVNRDRASARQDMK